MSEKIEFLKHEGLPIFRITYDDEAYRAVFTARVEEVTSWDTKSKEAVDLEPYIPSLMIKWDSCSHFNFGTENGYLHLCGVKDFKKHVMLMEWLYKAAFEVMGTPPQPDETW